MISTGMTRQLDSLGRIVVPIELRRTLDISSEDGLEIFVDDDKILLRKYTPGCLFCGESSNDLMPFRGKLICKNCRNEVLEQVR